MLNPSLLADIHLFPGGVGVNSAVANAASLLLLVMYSPQNQNPRGGGSGEG